MKRFFCECFMVFHETKGGLAFVNLSFKEVALVEPI